MAPNGDRSPAEAETAEPPFTVAKDRQVLADYIPIHIPAVEERAIPRPQHQERRFLDFLRARPSKEWFMSSRFVGRLRRPRSAAGIGGESQARRRRFRVSIVRKINWGALWEMAKQWAKQPANAALLVWLFVVGAGLFILFLFSVGAFDGVVRHQRSRDRWMEIINQILNALFTIVCLYQHPRLFHHLVLLVRWRDADRPELRLVYCADAAPGRPHERIHLSIVIFLLHATCVSQYISCALYWIYTRTTRPDWALNTCIAVGVVAPVIAGLYTVFSPLRRKAASEESDTEGQQLAAGDGRNSDEDITIYNRKVVVTSPEWIGGLFDCCDDRTVCLLSTFCPFCVFGWNMERLGFGNMYVHIFTFLLLCIGPFLVFNIAALNIKQEEARFTVLGVGILLCLCGLFYGGFWRTQMRRRYKLPPYRLWLGVPAATDCAIWFHLWPCALAQEVRTGNFYDVEGERFILKAHDEAGHSFIIPLPDDGDGGSELAVVPRSLSCPPKFTTREAADDSNGTVRAWMERSQTFNGLPSTRNGLWRPTLEPPVVETKMENGGS